MIMRKHEEEGTFSMPVP